MIRVKDLQMKELLFAFLNVKGYINKKVCKNGNDVPDHFVFESTLKKMSDDDTDEFVDSLNRYFNFGNKFVLMTKTKICMEFDNPENKTISELLEDIYKEVVKKQLSIGTEQFSKYFAIASFCFRGSIDLKRHFYTVDLHKSRMSLYKDIDHFMKLTVLTNFNDQLNLNFRELQGEGTRRDTQFRMNIRFFFDNYLDELKLVNPFRYRKLVDSKDEIMQISSAKKSNSFLQRVKFYLDNIVNNKSSLDDIKIAELRRRLEFSDENNTQDGIIRSNKTKEFALLTKPQECASCYKKYTNEQRTFKMRDSDFWYFEMHHVISFANSKYGIQTENVENYVKLCPACHRALTPDRADKDYQMNIISNILEHDEETTDFVKSVQNKVNSSISPNEFVYEHLK